MREELRDPGRLEHILASIDRIYNFVEGHIAEDLKGDSQLFYAVVKNLEIIGEAAYMLSPAFKENHPDTPWKRIIGLRHILVHDYYQVDADELWNIIAHDLQPLQSQVKEYRNEFKGLDRRLSRVSICIGASGSDEFLHQSTSDSIQ